jgi:uroporphyrin-III C-methyltransferase
LSPEPLLPRGFVSLVGAGPGDPDLLTQRAVRRLAEADVVFYDALVSPDVLPLAPRAQLISVGKRHGRHSASQETIERCLVRAARRGKRVVRLKAGDPFVFGRGGEELRALVEAGIEVEVIPGITAGTAVPAMLGIPVTHRDLAHGVTFITGHGAQVDWQAVVRSRTTLVIYMGLRNLANIASALKAAGMEPATPACIIENGTLGNQRQVITSLAQISGIGFAGPAIIVIGAVVNQARAISEHKAKAA